MSNMPKSGPTAGIRGEPDPIFAALERLWAARRGLLAADDRRGVLRTMIPKDRRRCEIFDGPPDGAPTPQSQPTQFP
jgi:hypothetical protein